MCYISNSETCQTSIQHQIHMVIQHYLCPKLYQRSFHLSLVLPSCMVVPVRDLGNKSVFSSSNTHFQQSFQLPTVSSSNYTGIDKFFTGLFPDNYDEMRGRFSSPNIQVSRNSLVSSTKSLVAYHKRMECNNTMIEDVNMDNDSPELSYKMTQEKTS